MRTGRDVPESGSPQTNRSLPGNGASEGSWPVRLPGSVSQCGDAPTDEDDRDQEEGSPSEDGNRLAGSGCAAGQPTDDCGLPLKLAGGTKRACVEAR